ncbi:MAG TPA: S8 family serine peptidase [Thermoanaerobaculia bacterium]|nr:S8 family serine peptidase [Thermoanaerobaculia bacterium]
MKFVRAAAAALFVASSLFAGSPDLERWEQRVPGEKTTGRYLMAEAEHVLSPEEIAEMKAAGLEVIGSLGGRRYLVLQKASAIPATAPLISLDPLAPKHKIQSTARREISKLRGWSSLRVLFHRDVDFETASSLIVREGGTLADPLATRFGPLGAIDVILPDSAALRLAGKQPVSAILGPMPQIVSHNRISAELSTANVVHQAPYDLTGEGVTVTVWDGSSVQASHPEFGGRVKAMDSSRAGVARHPTHVIGTIGAFGVVANAKGMAPAAEVFQYDFNTGNIYSRKDIGFAEHGSRVDNNSWGDVWGWYFASRGWEWWGNEFHGAYVYDSAVMDYLAIEHGTLIVYSTGNSNGSSGPGQAPNSHYHPMDDGSGSSRTYCYSADSSGTDCPVTCGVCEVDRHPANGPFGSIGIYSAAKNVVSVGAVRSTGSIGGFSDTGPAKDGRIKPEVVAMGVNVFSTVDGSGYGNSTGTSMAAPAVTGVAALLVEQWRKTMGEDPDAAALRGLLIHTAKDQGNPGPDYTYGFGLIQAEPAADTIVEDGGSGTRIVRGEMAQGGRMDIPMVISDSGPVILTLVWNDPPIELSGLDIADPALVNDLDLMVIGPSGESYPWKLDPGNPGADAVRGVNARDNVEQILIENAVPGEYLIRIAGTSVPEGPQGFWLLSSHETAGAGRVCGEFYEPNDTPEQAWGPLQSGKTIAAILCDSEDRDFYRFRVDYSGAVSVTVSSADTALEVTLSGGGGGDVTRTVAAGATGTLQTQVGSGSGVRIDGTPMLVEVRSAGEVGTMGSYSLTASYPTPDSSRRRGSRR